MVPHLNAGESHSYDNFYSHPDKPLRVHMNGVLEGVYRNTNLRIAEVAALFHDLGKLNENFQEKLASKSVLGYSSHAYLSAHIFLCFYIMNKSVVDTDWGLNEDHHIFSILTIIAHHHGNLSDVNRLLNSQELERFSNFLGTKPNIPVSDFLRQWLAHNSFDVNDDKFTKVLEKCWRIPDTKMPAISDKIGFFLETQFGFASLLESDKRDAGNNKWFQLTEQVEWAKSKFTDCLNYTLNSLESKSRLNEARTLLRIEATNKLKQLKSHNQRIFSLTAPTGSGKTLALLTLANEIREDHPEHSVFYALPFLAITEQVESICRESVFEQNPSFVTRIDSRTRNYAIEKILAELDTEPRKLEELLQQSFSIETFDAGFIITTFVQLFETLLSNRGSTLLRLPNFSKRIFLIDEVQALPPRLYIFLIAFLDAFCQKFDSYAILSTATMPALTLPTKGIDPNDDPRSLFPNYNVPLELVDYEKFFQMTVFDRYQIQRIDENINTFTLGELATEINQEAESCLVILNTIEDTRQLYRLLCPQLSCKDIVLLNTHFILDDRMQKILDCKMMLQKKHKVILISTQLIEAGVDIDFPVVYRDLCPLPNLIQSAGRCNRNKLMKRGQVKFFELHDENNKSRAELIYRDHADHWILDFSRKHICGTINEHDLFSIQKEYFELINHNLEIGHHQLWVDGKKQPDNIIKRINEAAFEIVGSFRLIDENLFGQEIRYYVPSSDDDTGWEDLEKLTTEMGKVIKTAGGRLSFSEMKKHQVAIDNQLRRLSGRIVQIRIFNPNDAPFAQTSNGVVKEICGLRKMLFPDINYSFYTGVMFNRQVAMIL